MGTRLEPVGDSCVSGVPSLSAGLVCFINKCPWAPDVYWSAAGKLNIICIETKTSKEDLFMVKKEVLCGTKGKTHANVYVHPVRQHF